MTRTSKVLSLSLAKGILMLVHVVSGMFFARVLSVADYGTYLQTFLAYDFAVPILTLGMPSALYYFLPKEKERKKGIVLDNLVLMFLSGLVFSLFLLLGGTELLAKRFNNPDLTQTLRWMVFYPLYTFPVLIGSSVWVSQDKVKLNAWYNVITGLILSLALIISVLMTRDYQLPTMVRIYLPIVFLPVSVYYIFKHVSGKWSTPNIVSMFNLAKFAIPLGLASIFGTLAIQLAGVVVSYLTSPKEYALFANGAKEVPFIGIITGSISVVILADMAKSIENGEIRKALELFRKAAAISASFLFPVLIFLMIFSESFIEILYSKKYAESVLPFRIYLFMIPIRIAYYGAAFIAMGKTRLILYRSIVDLALTLAMCYVFVLWLGASGAALGLVVTMFLWTVPFNLYSLSKMFSCSPMHMLPLKRLLKILIISILSAILPSLVLLFQLNPFLEFFVALIIYISIYVGLSFYYLLEFREFVQPLFLRLLNFKSIN